MPVILYHIGVLGSTDPSANAYAMATMRSMISMMTALGGITVVIVMCIPFNRFRTIIVSIVVGNVALFALGMPRVFIGANSMNFSGETVQILIREAFQPWNAEAVKVIFMNVSGNFNVWAVVPMVVFVFVMIPGYYLIVRGINKYLAKKNAAEEEAEIAKNQNFDQQK